MARIASIRRKIVPLALLGLLALLPGIGSSFVAVGADLTDQGTTSAAKAQLDPAGNYTFTLPNGWQSASASNGDARFVDSVNGTELVINTTRVNGRGIGQVMKEAKDAFGHQRGYRSGPVADQDLTLGGQPAIGLRFYSDSANVNQNATVGVASIYKGNAYILTFRVDQDHEKAVNQTIVAILNSWQFI